MAVSGKQLRTLARARLRDSEVLFDAKRYDGVVYLCGYVVELALKARICRTLKWTDYNTGRDYQSFKTHNLDALLELTGIQTKVKPARLTDWEMIASWDPELRYMPLGSATRKDAQEMINAARELLRVIK